MSEQKGLLTHLRSNWGGLLAFLLGGAMLLMTCETRGTGAVTVRGEAFQAEIIASPHESARGLMDRGSIPRNDCALFLIGAFEGREVPIKMWMKDCLFAMDVAWFDRAGKVVALKENLPPVPSGTSNTPPIYGGEVPAWGFVEFQAGTLARTGLAVGDVIQWHIHSRPFYPMGLFPRS